MENNFLVFNVLDIDKYYDFIVSAYKKTFFLTFDEIKNLKIEKEIQRERINGAGSIFK